jgi:hypothetical protein
MFIFKINNINNNMNNRFISIPSTVAIDSFKKQILFFQYQHLKVYTTDAVNKAIIPIIKYNEYSDKSKAIQNVDWDMKLPYKMVESVYDLININSLYNPKIYIPINVFTSAKQIIKDLDDDTLVEIIDADLVHLKHYPIDYHNLKDNEVIADNYYENWHMFISKPESENRKIISEFLTHNEEGYMNGGFNVIGKVKTIKSIIDDIILYSIKVTEKMNGDPHSWWCAMYGLNIACHNNKIKMINGDNCYYPNVNKLEDKHYIAHYSCDPHYNKRLIPNVNVDLFPDNVFYTAAKEYLSKTFN